MIQLHLSNALLQVRSDKPIFGEGAFENLGLLYFLFYPPRRQHAISSVTTENLRSVPLGPRLSCRPPLECSRRTDSMRHCTHTISKSRGSRAPRPWTSSDRAAGGWAILNLKVLVSEAPLSLPKSVEERRSCPRSSRAGISRRPPKQRVID